MFGDLVVFLRAVIWLIVEYFKVGKSYIKYVTAQKIIPSIMKDNCQFQLSFLPSVIL